MSITEDDKGKWLSGPISRLESQRDAVKASIQELLGPMLTPVPVHVLWKPLLDFPEEEILGKTKEMLIAITAGNILITSVLRRHAAGQIGWKDAMATLQTIVGDEKSQSKLHDQIGLIIGTAPELFSFYFLLFTLAR